MVYFVGAGPGAKDLITVRGMRLLEQADVIIYAGSLVNPELLSYAGSGAKIYDSAKMTLEEVLAVIREAEEKGLTTVRLHTGEPSLYGAVREQMDVLAAEGISARVLDFHTLKPLDEALLLKAARETGAVVTCEEHNVVGGLGEAVAGYLSGVCPVPVVRHGVNDVFGRSGKAPLVLEHFGLTPAVIAEKARAALAMKA